MEGGTEALEWSKKKGGYHLKWGYSKWTCTNLYLLESVFRVSALRPAGKNGERKGRKLSFFGERMGGQRKGQRRWCLKRMNWSMRWLPYSGGQAARPQLLGVCRRTTQIACSPLFRGLCKYWQVQVAVAPLPARLQNLLAWVGCTRERLECGAAPTRA